MLEYPQILTQQQRNELKPSVIAFCQKPRTAPEIAEKFNISQQDARTILNNLRWARDCEYNLGTNSYAAVKKLKCHKSSTVKRSIG
jgi:hypothetical protein